MRLSLRDTLFAGLAILVAALAVTLLPGGAAGPASAIAKGGACKYANTKPGKAAPKRFAKATICLIKQKRKQHHAGSISGDSKLAKSSMRHTKHMAKTGCFAHQCGGEASTETRIRSTGYFNGARTWSYGEVIAWGKGKRGTPKRIVNAWMGSPPHRSTILTSKFRDLGVGFQPKRPGGGKGGTYTVNFGLSK